MKDTDRFLVSIPGMTVDRIRDGRLERFMVAEGVSYANMKIEQVEALEALYAEVAQRMVELGNSSAKK